jgi:hypothetical protein
VTQPGTTQTIAAGATTTVVTVTAPNKSVEGGVLGAKQAIVTVTTPAHVVHLPRRVVTEVVRLHAVARTIFVDIVRMCTGMKG